MSDYRASHKNIVDYWYGKRITSDGRISEHAGMPILIDKDELSCWACDAPLGERQLERCHILAASLGGEGTADNMFLLCPRCHEESPDTTNREAFFRWVYKSRKTHFMGVKSADIVGKAIDEELQERGIMKFEELFKTLPTSKQEELQKMCSYGENSDMIEYVGKHTTSHFGVNAANFNSTIIAIVDYILECYYKLVIDGFKSTAVSVKGA